MPDMTTQVQVHVGEGIDALGARARAAWDALQRGEPVSERHVTFADWETMVRVISPKRLALLRHIHLAPARNIRALALSLGRDYRRVHEDVEALQQAGLLDRTKDGVRADYQALDVTMHVAL